MKLPMMESTIIVLKDMRSDAIFSKFLSEAKQMAEDYGIEQNFRVRRSGLGRKCEGKLHRMSLSRIQKNASSKFTSSF